MILNALPRVNEMGGVLKIVKCSKSFSNRIALTFTDVGSQIKQQAVTTNNANLKSEIFPPPPTTNISSPNYFQERHFHHFQHSEPQKPRRHSIQDIPLGIHLYI